LVRAQGIGPCSTALSEQPQLPAKLARIAEDGGADPQRLPAQRCSKPRQPWLVHLP